MSQTYEQISNSTIPCEEEYQRFDTVIGTVIGFNDYGCYVRDSKNDKVVFYFGNGTKGDLVQLSVKRVDAKRERVTCSLDSVLEYSECAA